MAYSNILTETEFSTQIITINRPDKLNALNKETIEELGRAFSAAESNSDIRAIVITGTGEKAFVAGADISEFYQFSVDKGKELSAKGHEILFDLVENFCFHQDLLKSLWKIHLEYYFRRSRLNLKI